MNITTNFGPGDKVVTIGQICGQKEIPCVACDENGKVTLSGEEYVCPRCRGEGVFRTQTGMRWLPSHESVVGKVSVEIQNVDYDGNPVWTRRVTYMIAATGIGSGTLHEEANVLGSVEAAKEECKRRNDLLDKDVG